MSLKTMSRKLFCIFFLDVYNHLAGERSIFGIHLSTSFTAEWLRITDSLLEAAGIAAAEYWCFCDKSCHNKYVFKLNIRYKDTKKYCNYAPIRKKIFFEERILRSFEVVMPRKKIAVL